MKMKHAFVLIVAFLTCGCPQDRTEFDQVARWNQEAEERLVGAETDSSDLLPKLSQSIVKQADISGQWDSSYWHDGVHLTIEKHPDGRYGVVYRARGDLASWTLKRTARFENGVLEFDKPVEEYAPHAPYKRFYLLRVGNSPRFVSHPVAKEWLIGKAPKEWNSAVVDLVMLERARTGPTDAPDKKDNFRSRSPRENQRGFHRHASTSSPPQCLPLPIVRRQPVPKSSR